jgi:beta-galactosidase
LDACDELGLVVMNCLMGWQYFGKDPAFAELKYQECRQLVRRDRNHPSVILWEVSLNESDMPKSFVETTHKIAHEEYPGDQCYTCGWTRGYDVFIQARQHGGCKKAQGIACLVSEYGDWEYYAQNAGLEQHKWKDLKPAERSSRQLRGDGEIRLLQQALNFQEAHNDNLKTTAFADGLWVMYDYSRGYAEDIESSGVMDVFRLPKFSYWFYKSQREPDEQVNGRAAGPMVFIANYWTHESPLDVRVFSNCEEVSLYLNGKLVERRRPDPDRVSDRLRNPPFTFKLAAFEPGELRAVGHIDGGEAASHQRRTPGEPDQLTLHFDLSDRPFALSGKDAVFCYAEVLDENGVVVPGASMPVSFGAAAVDRLIGSPAAAEAGVASVLVESDDLNPATAVYALCIAQDKEEIRVLSASASPNKKHAPDYKVVYTVDGSEPTNASPEYRGPITNAARVRAAIIAKGKIVARAASLPQP